MSEEPSTYDAGEPAAVYHSTEERIAAFLADPRYAGAFGAYSLEQIDAAIGMLIAPQAPDVVIARELTLAMTDGRLTWKGRA